MMKIKRILTRFVLGFCFAFLVFILQVLYAFNTIPHNVEPKDPEVIALEKNVTTYLINHFFLPADSMVLPPAGLKEFFRPELKKALHEGAIKKITRGDFNAATEKGFELAGSSKLLKSKTKAGWAILILCCSSVLFFILWVMLHDPVLNIYGQYKKGRLYNSLEREISEKDRDLHQQKGYTDHWKTKAEELETAYQALNQKYNTLYSHLKEKQEAEKAAAEKAKQETEKKKIMKEEAKIKAAALD
jgi:hypothetical protein